MINAIARELFAAIGLAGCLYAGFLWLVARGWL